MTASHPVADRPERSPSSELRVEQVSGSAPEWDRFVAGAEGSTFCHLGGWERIMTEVFRHECLYLAAIDDGGQWRGVLPLVRVRSLLGHYLISVPFLNDGGPLGDGAARLRLVEHALAEAKRSGADLLELRSRADLPGPLEPSNRKITVHLPLPDNVEALWEKTFRAKLRSQVRRPSKEGMTARSGPAELSTFYKVFARNMRDLGTPVLPRAFFEHLLVTFGDRVLFTSVHAADGRPAAAGCSVVWRDEIEIVWASALREFNKFSPNMLLYAHTMEEAIARGVRVFNFGRCTPGGATHKFKQQWGGHDVPLPWPTWSREPASGTPSAERPALQLATAVWKHLPVPIASLVGPRLARHLP